MNIAANTTPITSILVPLPTINTVNREIFEAVGIPPRINNLPDTTKWKLLKKEEILFIKLENHPSLALLMI